MSLHFCHAIESKLMADPANHSPRSAEPSDYQDLQQSIGAMAKSFVDGYRIPLHHHDRDQPLYAVRGVMRLRTKHEMSQ